MDLATAPRRLDYVPLDELVPDPRNPKAHDIDELRASLGRFGYVEPIIEDGRTGLLVAGHGRRELLLDDRENGREPPEGVVVDADVWLVPVVRGWSSENDDEAGAYLVASNQIGKEAGFLADPLAALLDQVRSNTPAGLDGIGFSTEQLDAMLADLAAPDGFGPVPADQQPRLDQREPITCPHCGESFVPGA